MTEPVRTLAARLARQYSTDPTWGWKRWREFVEAEIAEVRLRQLPGHLGVSLRHTPLQHPVILVDRDVTGPRRLFTLAHEVGHVCVGWHGRRVTCTESDLFAPAEQEEQEANAFAAELLVPEFWLRELVGKVGLPKAIELAYQRSHASPTTVSLQLLRALDPGWVFVQIEQSSGQVKYRGQSSGTDVNLPARDSFWSVDTAVGALESWEVRPVGWSTVYWLRYPTTTPLARTTTETASEILKRILDELPLSDTERGHLTHSVNGVCGAAKNRLASDADASSAAALLWQRLDGRAKLRDVVGHPDFGAFVSQKARELVA